MSEQENVKTERREAVGSSAWLGIPATYTKKIEITDTGMVIASVFAPAGQRVGLEFFDPLWKTTANIERKARKAHAWADNHAKMCAAMEADRMPNAEVRDRHPEGGNEKQGDRAGGGSLD